MDGIERYTAYKWDAIASIWRGHSPRLENNASWSETTIDRNKGWQQLFFMDYLETGGVPLESASLCLTVSNISLARIGNAEP